MSGQAQHGFNFFSDLSVGGLWRREGKSKKGGLKLLLVGHVAKVFHLSVISGGRSLALAFDSRPPITEAK